MLILAAVNLAIFFIIIAAITLVYRKPQFLMLPLMLFVTAATDYFLIGQINFINRLFVLFTFLCFITFYLFPYPYRVERIMPLLLLTLSSSAYIPVLLYTSMQSTYISTAYLSVSLIILGIIFYVLGWIDRREQTDTYSIYRIFKRPLEIGIIILFAAVPVMTMFIPYAYLYILWYMMFVLYCFSHMLIQRLRKISQKNQ